MRERKYLAFEKYLCMVFQILYIMTPIYKYFQLGGSVPIVNLSLIRFFVFIISFGVFCARFSTIKKIIGKNICYIFLLGYVFILITCVLSYLNSNLIPYEADRQEYISSTVVNYFMMFYTGIIIYTNLQAFNKLTLTLWVLFIIFFIPRYSSIIASSRTSLISDVNISYILFADNFAFLSLITLWGFKKAWSKHLFFFASLIILFFLPSRTSFYLFAASYFFSQLFFVKYHKAFNWIFVALLSVIFFSYLTQFADSRIFSLSLETDTSLAAREQFFSNNIGVIFNNPVFGDFMSDFVRAGNINGEFIHNYLSLYQNFGLIPFLSIIWLVCIAILRTWNLNHSLKPEIVMLLFFSVLEIIIARSFTNSLVWFACAFSICVARNKNCFISP
jgi:hypothetical protein